MVEDEQRRPLGRLGEPRAQPGRADLAKAAAVPADLERVEDEDANRQILDRILDEAAGGRLVREKRRGKARGCRDCPSPDRPGRADPAIASFRSAGRSRCRRHCRRCRRWRAADRAAGSSRLSSRSVRSSRWRFSSSGLPGSKPRWMSVICATSTRSSPSSAGRLQAGGPGSPSSPSAGRAPAAEQHRRRAAVHMEIVAHRAGRGDRAAVVSPPWQARQEARSGSSRSVARVRRWRAVAAGAGFRALGPRLAGALDDLVGAVIEPAVQHVAGREGDRPDPVIERSGRRLDHLMAIEAGAALREDRADRLVGARRRGWPGRGRTGPRRGSGRRRRGGCARRRSSSGGRCGPPAR